MVYIDITLLSDVFTLVTMVMSIFYFINELHTDSDFSFMNNGMGKLLNSTGLILSFVCTLNTVIAGYFDRIEDTGTTTNTIIVEFRKNMKNVEQKLRDLTLICLFVIVGLHSDLNKAHGRRTVLLIFIGVTRALKTLDLFVFNKSPAYKVLGDFRSEKKPEPIDGVHNVFAFLLFLYAFLYEGLTVKSGWDSLHQIMIIVSMVGQCVQFIFFLGRQQDSTNNTTEIIIETVTTLIHLITIIALLSVLEEQLSPDCIVPVVCVMVGDIVSRIGIAYSKDTSDKKPKLSTALFVTNSASIVISVIAIIVLETMEDKLHKSSTSTPSPSPYAPSPSVPSPSGNHSTGNTSDDHSTGNIFLTIAKALIIVKLGSAFVYLCRKAVAMCFSSDGGNAMHADAIYRTVSNRVTTILLFVSSYLLMDEYENDTAVVVLFLCTLAHRFCDMCYNHSNKDFELSDFFGLNSSLKKDKKPDYANFRSWLVVGLLVASVSNIPTIASKPHWSKVCYIIFVTLHLLVALFALGLINMFDICFPDNKAGNKSMFGRIIVAGLSASTYELVRTVVSTFGIVCAGSWMFVTPGVNMVVSFVAYMFADAVGRNHM